MLIPVLIGVTFLVFSILSLAPGDPVLVVLGDNATEEAADAMRHDLGLDRPFFERYITYIWNLLRGDFGKSYKTKLSVSDQILSRFPNTLILASASMFIALVLGIPLGILSAKKQYTLLDNITTVGGLISVSMPNFWLGLLLVILFALKLRWLPSQGMAEGFIPLLKSLILPSITLGTGIMASIMRMTRSSVLETMRQDYVSTARSKGISERQVTIRHMLKNALIPIITTAGLQFGHLLGGSMLTETVFSWPGVGRYMLDAIKTKDTPAVLGSVILMSVSFSVVNLLVDILYAFVDPRIKSQYKRRRHAVN
ncbi:MAG: ABC transporter permease [Oscillospiraceae bacterium]|nr:ABC transporter permease [Oscillospiraceae bacterium]